jgi:hypothetical protein
VNSFGTVQVDQHRGERRVVLDPLPVGVVHDLVEKVRNVSTKSTTR